MEKKCETCAWFCHADGKCYGNGTMINEYGFEIGLPTLEQDGWTCPLWAFDGLEEWERREWETR